MKKTRKYRTDDMRAKVENHMRRSQCVRPAGRDPRGNTAELRRVQMDGLLVDLRHFSRWLQPPARLIGSLSGGNPRSMRSRPCLKSSARWIALTTTIAKSESGFPKVNLLPGLIGWISAVDGCLALFLPEDDLD